jgi:hypothetical protein
MAAGRAYCEHQGVLLAFLGKHAIAIRSSSEARALTLANRLRAQGFATPPENAQ